MQDFETKIEFNEISNDEFNDKIKIIESNLVEFFDESNSLENDIYNSIKGLRYV